jgi:hypothetical protein
MRKRAGACGGAGVAGERHGARWGRTLLALTAGLLLTVPLLWAASIRSWVPKEVEGWRILPMLPREARLPLPSDLRMCTNSAQCEPPRVCFLDPRYLFPFCQGSDCVTDAQCPRGNACRSVPVEGQGVALRRCAPWGERTEGESCARLVWANQRGLACGAELVCVGEGWCGRRCEPGWPGSCPAGFFCARGDPEGATCLPTCEGRTCPEGQRCVRHEGGVSACAVVHGGDCQQRPCEDGEVCDVLTRVERPGEVWMQCARPCDRDEDDRCEPGYACHEGRCRAFCYPDEPVSCHDPDDFCLETSDEGYGLCMRSLGERRADAEAEPEGG